MFLIGLAVVANAPLRVPADPLIELVVRTGFGAADDWIAQEAGPGDIVVTADIPLAARCLAKEACVLDPKGRPFTESDIGSALALRDLMSDLRQTGAVTGGPALVGGQEPPTHRTWRWTVKQLPAARPPFPEEAPLPWTRGNYGRALAILVALPAGFGVLLGRAAPRPATPTD